MVVTVLLVGSVASAAPPGQTPAAEPSLPSWMLAADPLLVEFSAYYEVSAARGLGRHSAFDLSYAHWRSSDDPRWNNGVEFALRVPVYFSHRFEGLFLEPGVIARFSDNVENTHDFEGPELLAGYQHTWDFGLTIAGAIGPALPAATTLSSYGMTPLDGYLRVGWVF